jgi:hypothetical protein
MSIAQLEATLRESKQPHARDRHGSLVWPQITGFKIPHTVILKDIDDHIEARVIFPYQPAVPRIEDFAKCVYACFDAEYEDLLVEWVPKEKTINLITRFTDAEDAQWGMEVFVRACDDFSFLLSATTEDKDWDESSIMFYLMPRQDEQ